MNFSKGSTNHKTHHLLFAKVVALPDLFSSKSLKLVHPHFPGKEIHVAVGNFPGNRCTLLHLPLNTDMHITVEVITETEKILNVKILKFIGTFPKPEKLKVLVFKGGYQRQQYVRVLLENGNITIYDTIEQLEEALEYYREHPRYYIEYLIDVE